MLTASGLEKSYAARRLFRDVTLELSAGRRIALVGGNGTGKTTLIEILVGLNDADAGTITRPRDLELGYLPQDLKDTPSGTVVEEVMAGAGPVARLGEELHRLEESLTKPGDDYDEVLARYGDVQSRFEQLGGYALEADARKVMAGLGFADSDGNRPVAELSGGFRMRVDSRSCRDRADSGTRAVARSGTCRAAHPSRG